MSGRFVSIGFHNVINADRVVAILTADSTPCKRLIATRREEGLVLDCTCGRRTKSVLVTNDRFVVLCALSVATVAMRLNGLNTEESEET